MIVVPPCMLINLIGGGVGGSSCIGIGDNCCQHQ